MVPDVQLSKMDYPAPSVDFVSFSCMLAALPEVGFVCDDEKVFGYELIR